MMENQSQHPLDLLWGHIMEQGLVVIDDVTSMPVYGEPYVSSHLVICLNKRGWIRIEYDMQPVEFRHFGLSVIFPDHVVLAHESSDDYLATLVVVSKEFLDTLNNRSTYRNHLAYLKKPDFALTPDQYENVLAIINVLRIVSQTKSPARMDMLANMLGVFSRIVDEYRFANKTNMQQDSKHNNPIFSRFCNSIVEHYRESREVCFYADQQHLSPKYFAQLIKKETGISATHWIANYVIIQAKSILAHHREMNIQQVSEVLGFPDQSTFSRYFKSHAQMSPSEYRIKS